MYLFIYLPLCIILYNSMSCEVSGCVAMKQYGGFTAPLHITFLLDSALFQKGRFYLFVIGYNFEYSIATVSVDVVLSLTRILIQTYFVYLTSVVLEYYNAYYKKT